MNKEIKERWLTALRSGDYAQGRCTLRDENNQFCCLGVLANIMGVTWQKNPAGYFYELEGQATEWQGNLALETKDIAGLTYVRDLIRMNDSGESFNDIADWIEENE